MNGPTIPFNNCCCGCCLNGEHILPESLTVSFVTLEQLFTVCGGSTPGSDFGCGFFNLIPDSLLGSTITLELGGDACATGAKKYARTYEESQRRGVAVAWSKRMNCSSYGGTCILAIFPCCFAKQDCFFSGGCADGRTVTFCECGCMQFFTAPIGDDCTPEGFNGDCGGPPHEGQCGWPFTCFNDPGYPPTGEFCTSDPLSWHHCWFDITE